MWPRKRKSLKEKKFDANTIFSFFFFSSFPLLRRFRRLVSSFVSV
jgi:hypothetical protein